MRKIYVLVVFVLVMLVSSTSIADTFVVAKTGHVEAYFLGSSAGYTNKFTINFEDISSTPVERPAFISNKSEVGTYFDFGTHNAGMQAIFVNNTVDTNNYWYSWVPFNNDGVNHMIYTQIYLQDMTPALIVRWEDSYDGGDLDYNDNVLLVTNVMAAVPEPSTY